MLRLSGIEERTDHHVHARHLRERADRRCDPLACQAGRPARQRRSVGGGHHRQGAERIEPAAAACDVHVADDPLFVVERRCNGLLLCEPRLHDVENAAQLLPIRSVERELALERDLLRQEREAIGSLFG